MTDASRKIESLYDAFMTPLEAWAGLSSCRKGLLPRARGAVLEAGPGTGVNARYYLPESVDSITLISPGEVPGERLMERYRSLGIPVSYVPGDVERLPYPGGTFDTVVATLLFCTVADPLSGFRELLRVLKPEGEYLFIEHVRPKRPGYAWAADIATPLWRRIAGGCHLNRETETIMSRAGFRIDDSCVHAKGVFIGGAARRGDLRKTI